MGNFIKLKAEDGHGLGAYEAKPSGKPPGDARATARLPPNIYFLQWMAG